MMRVLLIDDPQSKIPNLALMKISAWRKACGDEVGFEIEDPDKVYISCIFKENAEQMRGIASFFSGSEVDLGGSGINLTKTLPEIVELIKPDYDLYPSTYSQGYTSRGCSNRCGFCIVPEKEGRIREVQLPERFHDDRFDTCMIQDNNLFATSEVWQWNVFQWFIDTGTKMIDHGFDARLLNEKRADKLRQIKHSGPVHFAWDHMKDEGAVLRAIRYLDNAGFDLKREIMIYVLVGYDTSFEQDVYRCEKLRELGVQPYVMRYRKAPDLNALARWVNSSYAFWSKDCPTFSLYTRKAKKAGIVKEIASDGV
jgi:hypothetical protein